MNASLLGALCLFSSVCVVCAISAFTLPIETKGRALQVSDAEIASVFLTTIFGPTGINLESGNSSLKQT